MNEQNIVFNLLAFFLSFVGVKIVPWRTGPGAMDGDGRIVGCDKYITATPKYPLAGSPVEDFIAWEAADEEAAEFFSFEMPLRSFEP